MYCIVFLNFNLCAASDQSIFHLLGIIMFPGAFFLVDTNISIHALNNEALILYNYVDLAQFADTKEDKEIGEISLNR